jgi:hypothetical protein
VTLSDGTKSFLIEAELRDRPEVSNRAIAADLGVSHHTVNSVRENVGGQIAHHEKRIGRDGVAQPASKPIVSRFDFGEKHVRGTLGTGEKGGARRASPRPSLPPVHPRRIL